MVDTVLVGLLCGAAALVIFIVIIALCVRSRGGREYAPIPEKGVVIPYADPTIDQKKALEAAQMNARFYLRSARFTLEKYLPEIGSREHKFYYLVKSSSGDAREGIMSMIHKTINWPIQLDSETGRQTFIKIMKSIEEHPFIATPIVMDYIFEKNTAVTIRPFYPKGSLKDFIHKAKPLRRYGEKYETVYELNEKLIAKFGRQILEGLAYLKYQAIPYYHLHSGNILVEDNNCYITEIENVFVGAQPYLLPILRALIDKVDPEVICFGCILFEMAVGYELESSEAYSLGVPSECPDKVKKVLDAIFQPWYGSPPTVEDLLQMELFADVKIKKPFYQRNQYSNKEKDMVAAVKKCMQAMLKSAPIDPSDFKLKKKIPKKVTPFEQNDISIPSSPYSNAGAGPLSPGRIPSSSSSLTSSTSSLSSSLPLSSSATIPPPPSSSSSSKPPPPAAAAKPPPPPPAPKAGAPPPPPPPPAGGAGGKPPPAKAALLSSIEGFSTKGLKKTVTKDKSGPKLRN